MISSVKQSTYTDALVRFAFDEGNVYFKSANDNVGGPASWQLVTDKSVFENGGEGYVFGML